MFITWGLYSQLGRWEWTMHNERIPLREYDKLANEEQVARTLTHQAEMRDDGRESVKAREGGNERPRC